MCGDDYDTIADVMKKLGCKRKRSYLMDDLINARMEKHQEVMDTILSMPYKEFEKVLFVIKHTKSVETNTKYVPYILRHDKKIPLPLF